MKRPKRKKQYRREPSQYASRETRDYELYLALCDWADADWDDLSEGHVNFWRLFDAIKRMRGAMKRYDPGLRIYGRAVTKRNGILS
jgi:hypothetical protein